MKTLMPVLCLLAIFLLMAISYTPADSPEECPEFAEVEAAEQMFWEVFTGQKYDQMLTLRDSLQTVLNSITGNEECAKYASLIQGRLGFFYTWYFSEQGPINANPADNTSTSAIGEDCKPTKKPQCLWEAEYYFNLSATANAKKANLG